MTSSLVIFALRNNTDFSTYLMQQLVERVFHSQLLPFECVLGSHIALCTRPGFFPCLSTFLFSTSRQPKSLRPFGSKATLHIPLDIRFMYSLRIASSHYFLPSCLNTFAMVCGTSSSGFTRLTHSHMPDSVS